MIKVLVCDGEGTLMLPNPSDEVRELLNTLPELGIELAVASNAWNASGIVANFRRAGLPVPNVIVTKAEVGNGIKKPSPEFIYKIQAATGVELKEMVYLGDDDNTDTFCAINARVLPCTAEYSNSGKPMEYGIPVTTPKAMTDYLCSFAKQDAPYFGWNFNGVCTDTRTRIDVRSLFGDHGELGLTTDLKKLLKEKQDVYVGSKRNHLGGVLFHYLVSQTYLSGLIQGIDAIAVYPGHTANSQNPILEAYSDILRQTFRQRYLPNLLIRHTDAPDLRAIRGSSRTPYEQFKTVLVNPAHQRKVRDQSILVLDDFTTSGCSIETARRMLLQAGAARVVGLAIAKWGNNYLVTRLARGWNPFEPCDLKPEEIGISWQRGSLNWQADEYFQKHIWPIYTK